ncbi:hypothetical protein SLEP1_g56960 [Rubroshorea leprosula]|uniref:Secreted protein n=1 Tax=Rubroshorea leprosula TaxID=152421 RepID=A0AAV5MLA7_9ROSI|nr:hypothetical protein SLEP1_g56960 [Rubroshorea leprosula]
MEILRLLIVFSGIPFFLCTEALGFRVLLLEPSGSPAAQARWSRPVPCSNDPMRSRGSLLPHANLPSCMLEFPRSGLRLFILVLRGTQIWVPRGTQPGVGWRNLTRSGFREEPSSGFLGSSKNCRSAFVCFLGTNRVSAKLASS